MIFQFKSLYACTNTHILWETCLQVKGYVKHFLNAKKGILKGMKIQFSILKKLEIFCTNEGNINLVE